MGHTSKFTMDVEEEWSPLENHGVVIDMWGDECQVHVNRSFLKSTSPWNILTSVLLFLFSFSFVNKASFCPRAEQISHHLEFHSTQICLDLSLYYVVT